MDGGGGGDESPSELDFPVGTDGGLAGALYERMSPDDCSEDGGAAPSDRPAPDGAGRGRSPGWALAMFGGDWFGKDVIQYAENLGQRSAACLDVKTQVGAGAEPAGCRSDRRVSLRWAFFSRRWFLTGAEKEQRVSVEKSGGARSLLSNFIYVSGRIVVGRWPGAPLGSRRRR